MVLLSNFIDLFIMHPHHEVVLHRLAPGAPGGTSILPGSGFVCPPTTDLFYLHGAQWNKKKSQLITKEFECVGLHVRLTYGRNKAPQLFGRVLAHSDTCSPHDLRAPCPGSCGIILLSTPLSLPMWLSSLYWYHDLICPPCRREAMTISITSADRTIRCPTEILWSTGGACRDMETSC